MRKRRRTVLYLAGGAIGLIVMFLMLRLVTEHPISSQIPEIQNSQTVSEPVKVQISAAVALTKRKPSADNLGMLGMVYHSSANYKEAAKCYELAIKRKKSQWIWNYYLGYLNMEMGESDAIVENFKQVIDKNPDIDLAWYYIGEEYKNLRKNELSIEYFDRITSSESRIERTEHRARYDYFPLSTYAMFQLSRIYFDAGSMALAEKTLKEIILSSRSFGPAYRLLGNVYRVNGEITLSEQARVRANDLVVFSPPVDTLVDRLVMMSRSELYLLKKIDEAEKSIYPEWAMELVNIAMQYFPENQYLISKAIKIYLMLELNKQAMALTDQHIGYFQENFTEMNNMGMLFFQKRLYPQSMKYFTRVLDLRPEDAEIQKCMAICLWTTGDKQESLDLLNELIEQNGGNPEVLAELTNLLFDLGENELASGYLSRLQKISPENPKVQKMSGRIAEENGDFLKAISMYESSFKGDPKDLTTIVYLGNILLRQKMWDKYIRHYRRALEYHPNDPSLLERLGTMLVTCPDPAMRRIEEGRDYSERAFIHTTSRSATLVSAGRSLALAYAELGDKQNASSIISMTLNIARRENMSQTYLGQLQSISDRIQTIEN